MRPIIITVAIGLLACMGTNSCNKEFIEIDSIEKEMFLGEEREGIYKNGEPLFIYSENTHQKALNPRRVQYRIQTDEQDTCLNVTLESLPERTGTHTTTSIDYRSPGELISSMNHLECSKITRDRIWLWNSSSLTGVILDISGLQQ